MAFNADGTRLFVAIGGDQDDILEYSLTTGFDVDGGDTYEGYYSTTYSGISLFLKLPSSRNVLFTSPD